MSLKDYLMKNLKGAGKKVGGAAADVIGEAAPFAAWGGVGKDMAKDFGKRNPKTAGALLGALGGGAAVHELEDDGDEDDEKAKIDALLEKMGLV
jgi:hypothetical protein